MADHADTSRTAIIGYSIFAYRVFGGKAHDLRYD